MTPVGFGACQALMRLAFTRSFTHRVDVLPIQDALWKIFGIVADEFGSTVTLLHPVLKEDVLELSALVVKKVQGEEETKFLMSSLNPDDRKLAKVWCPGLGQVLGMQMLNYARQYRKDMFGLKVRRNKILTDRRNQLANSFAGVAIERAEMRMQEIGRTQNA
jgi:hypothetical protein